MPLRPGYSHATFEYNIRELKRAGHPHNVAMAAAFNNARKSFLQAHPDMPLPDWLKIAKRRKENCKPCDERAYREASQPGHGKNPVPPSKRVQLRNASRLYSDFTGHEAEVVETVDKPVLPDVMLIVGDIDFIGYTTVRDGVTEKYIHKFTKKCRPLFTVSHDGKQLFMLGGSYDFTERGIVDKT